MRRHMNIGGALGVILAAMTVATGADGPPRAKGPGFGERAFVIEGEALFTKIWTTVNDPEKGDGLGPLYNEASCVACHWQGGPGGGGRNDTNVVLLIASGKGGGDSVFRGELDALHPAFRDGSSVVLHKNATAEADEERLKRLRTYTTIETHDGPIALTRAQRNTPALFGSGIIDAIPEVALYRAAAGSFPDFPDIKGRVAKVKDGRVGRFGWKGQMSTLRGFVLAACANEMGLEVPGHRQASFTPPTPTVQPGPEPDGKLDMNAVEAGLLIDYVRALARPVFRVPPEVERLKYGPMALVPERGRAVFDNIGCATCHAPRLGEVDGLYSDLLLHDMGEVLVGGGGGYGVSTPRTNLAETKPARPTHGPAAPTEWRTPPLWGVASSAPYLHDGRAATLDEAIRAHGGEAKGIAARYTRLDTLDGQSLLAFLHSLAAPTPPGAAPDVRPKANTPSRASLISRKPFTGAM
jgi:CxxC motif-containing protein (DUF1111 family)